MVSRKFLKNSYTTNDEKKVSNDMKAKLVINNVERILGHRELADICYSIKDCEGNEEIFHELAKSKSVEIRTLIASNSNLSDETVDLLMNYSSVEVLRAIISREHARMRMKKEALERFIETGDTEILMNLANRICEYADLEVCEMDWLCEKLLKQKDPAIRYKLAKNAYTPIFFLKKLANDDDINIAERAMKTLIENDDLYWIEE